MLFQGEGEGIVANQTIKHIEEVIQYIEENLSNKLDLDSVANATHFSKYHLHRMFAKTVGLTIHDYVLRRQLTEAAKLLVFSDKPIIEIALACGYESQAAFTVAFKAMYKAPPAEYRERRVFYPIQLRFALRSKSSDRCFSKSDIRLAEPSDIPSWMELMRMVIDGYPCLDETQYLEELRSRISEKEALILKEGDMAIGIMAFSDQAGSIDFFGVHRQYRNCGIQKLFLDKLIQELLPNREISTTTFREHDKADTGYRDELKRLGFAERELLTEFGYPTQRFVFVPQNTVNEQV